MNTTFGVFSGEPKTVWLTEDQADRRMKLVEAFSYKGKVMDVEVPKDYRIDGASIPRALWSLVGSPYTGDYRRASIVHDKACDDAIGDISARRAADRMFYYACRAGGCSWPQAVMLYIGVRIGAWLDRVPRWQEAQTQTGAPRLLRSAADLAIERDFSAAAAVVLRQCERTRIIDDADEIERRTDEILETLTGLDFRQA